jgi:hypothetical protein
MLDAQSNAEPQELKYECGGQGYVDPYGPRSCMFAKARGTRGWSGGQSWTGGRIVCLCHFERGRFIAAPIYSLA